MRGWDLQAATRQSRVTRLNAWCPPSLFGGRHAFSFFGLRLMIGPPLVALLLACLSVPLGAAQLDEIQRINQNGAPQLAERLFDQYQPAAQQDLQAWMLWERARIAVYESRANWHRVLDRLQSAPTELGAEDRQWIDLRRVNAHLNLSQGDGARRILRDLLWRAESVARDDFAAWRRLVIQSYIVDDLGEAAYRAMLRYEQDYGTAGPKPEPKPDARGGSDEQDWRENWPLLRARVLLLAGRAGDAVLALRGVRGEEAALLSLVARLRADPSRAAEVLKAASQDLRKQAAARAKQAKQQARKSKQKNSENTSPADYAGPLHWLALAAAEAAGEHGRRVSLLEQIYRADPLARADTALLGEVDASLWSAYAELAEQIGNQRQLLVGQDQAWFELAVSFLNKDGSKARALFAWLGLNARAETQALLAHQQLATSVLGENGGQALLRRLYVGSSLGAGRFSRAADIPWFVRHTLVDVALSESDIELASWLMADLERAPKGIRGFVWDLQRARVFVLAGQAERAVQVLHALLERVVALEQNDSDRLLQVLFDLQGIGQHQAAYDLFAELQAKSGNPRLRRELYYWMADSRKADQRYADAALLYLQSAAWDGLAAPDIWAQSALYQAAEALDKAGLVADARDVYLRLLQYTDDEGRKALLRRNLRQLEQQLAPPEPPAERQGGD